MKSLALAAALFAASAYADGTPVRAALHDALEAQADLPATPPSLPTAASERASTVHATIAFGQKGALERAAHAHAADDAAAAARAHSEAANHVAQQAAAADRDDDDERHSAAGQEHDQSTHGRGVNNGNGNGNGNPGGNGNLGRNPQRPLTLP